MTPSLVPIVLLLLLKSVESLAGRSYLVTGANKGQGLALCQRILAEHDDTHVFLCSREIEKGLEAASTLPKDRVDVIQLDVTSEASVNSAVELVRDKLNGHYLDGLVSNAGILWGHSLRELLDVCTVGVKRVLDGFMPLVKPDGTIIVVSSGLSPLMLSYSKYSQELMDIQSWQTIERFIEIMLDVEEKGGEPSMYEEAGFSGGPFAESVPDFHRYGLAKMLGDAYMFHLSRVHSTMRIHSADPGLVYTDLIDKMPKYNGKPIEETGAKSPHEGVEVHMRLLFGPPISSGQFHAINKEGELKSGTIDKRPDV